MIEAVMFWNEPNNKSHWDFEVDPGWEMFAAMVKLAGAAVHAENEKLLRVLGGLSPIDPDFIRNMDSKGVLSQIDVIALHGFPLDWNHWTIHEWPDKIQEIRDVTSLPIWVSEVGASTFGAEEVQEFGLRRTAELLIGRVARIHWYSLYDLPAAWPATTRHREAEGSAYYRPSTWACLTNTATRSARWGSLRTTHPRSVSASGFISTITVSTRRSCGCGAWG